MFGHQIGTLDLGTHVTFPNGGYVTNTPLSTQRNRNIISSYSEYNKHRWANLDISFPFNISKHEGTSCYAAYNLGDNTRCVCSENCDSPFRRLSEIAEQNKQLYIGLWMFPCTNMLYWFLCRHKKFQLSLLHSWWYKLWCGTWTVHFDLLNLCHRLVCSHL